MMMMKPFDAKRLARIAVATAIGASCTAISVTAIGQESDSARLVSMLNSQIAPRTPMSAYVDDTTGRKFFIDRSGPNVLMRYADSEEVYALLVSIGPGGDEYFRNDAGRVVLRIKEQRANGILFKQGDRAGAPIRIAAETSPILPPDIPASLTEGLMQIESDLRDLIGQSVTINVDDALKTDANWALEAAQTAAQGISRAESHISTGLRSLSLQHSEEPRALFDGAELTIGVAPDRGYAGRVSSEFVAALILKHN